MISPDVNRKIEVESLSFNCFSVRKELYDGGGHRSLARLPLAPGPTFCAYVLT